MAKRCLTSACDAISSVASATLTSVRALAVCARGVHVTDVGIWIFALIGVCNRNIGFKTAEQMM